MTVSTTILDYVSPISTILTTGRIVKVNKEAQDLERT